MARPSQGSAITGAELGISFLKMTDDCNLWSGLSENLMTSAHSVCVVYLTLVGKLVILSVLTNASPLCDFQVSGQGSAWQH